MSNAAMKLKAERVQDPEATLAVAKGAPATRLKAEQVQARLKSLPGGILLPSGRSEEALFQQWEALLAGLREAAPLTPRIVPLQAALQAALQEAVEIRDNREVFRAAAADARQNLARVLNRGRDAAMSARNYLKFHFGPYNDELTRFGVKPIQRNRGRKR